MIIGIRNKKNNLHENKTKNRMKERIPRDNFF